MIHFAITEIEKDKIIEDLKKQPNPFLDEFGNEKKSIDYKVKSLFELKKKIFIKELKEKHKIEVNSKEWKDKSREIKLRDENKCALCDFDKGLEVHHTIYFNDLRLWEYDNHYLITLCRFCHQKEHYNKSVGDLDRVTSLFYLTSELKNYDIKWEEKRKLMD